MKKAGYLKFILSAVLIAALLAACGGRPSVSCRKTTYSIVDADGTETVCYYTLTALEGERTGEEKTFAPDGTLLSTVYQGEVSCSEDYEAVVAGLQGDLELYRIAAGVIPNPYQGTYPIVTSDSDLSEYPVITSDDDLTEYPIITSDDDLVEYPIITSDSDLMVYAGEISLEEKHGTDGTLTEEFYHSPDGQYPGIRVTYEMVEVEEEK